MAEVNTVGKIENLGEIKVCHADFYDQLKSLRKAGVKYPISIRNAAYMRLHKSPKDWTRTCSAPVWYDKEQLLIAKISPLVKNLEMARLAVEANRNEKYFSTKDAELYEKYAKIAEQDKSKEPEKRKVIICPSNSNFRIQKNDETARALFEDTAEEYFDEFAKNGITVSTPDRDYTQNKKGTGVSYLWFYSPDLVSGLIGSSRGLYLGSRAFGVREYAEGVAKNLLYSAKEVQKVLRIAEDVRTGKLPISKLETIVEFLNILKQ